MDIEQFYEADERRRHSAEIEFGDDWTGASGESYELSWIKDTGELYLMLDPKGRVMIDIFGDGVVESEPVEALQVKVIATISDHDELERQLDGWASAMSAENSLRWLKERFPAT